MLININDDTVYMMDLKELEYILIDMDGVILDTAYDNYFWQTHIPRKYSELHSHSLDQATKITHSLFNLKKKTKDWYDLDYWSNMLGLDVEAEKLSPSMIEKISLKKDILSTLKELQSDKKLFLVTNAHRKTLNIKLKKYPIEKYFENIICSHELNYVKEDIQFWFILRNVLGIDYRKSILVEDTLDNIKSAYHAGLRSIFISDKEVHLPYVKSLKELSDLPPYLKQIQTM